MSKSVVVILLALVVLVVAGISYAPGMVLNLAADEVTKKFQGATCEQLKAQKEPPSMIKKAAVGFLRDDPQARVAFIDKIAAPVLNKMIECGMAP